MTPAIYAYVSRKVLRVVIHTLWREPTKLYLRVTSRTYADKRSTLLGGSALVLVIWSQHPCKWVGVLSFLYSSTSVITDRHDTDRLVSPEGCNPLARGTLRTCVCLSTKNPFPGVVVWGWFRKPGNLSQGITSSLQPRLRTKT